MHVAQGEKAEAYQQQGLQEGRKGHPPRPLPPGKAPAQEVGSWGQGKVHHVIPPMDYRKEVEQEAKLDDGKKKLRICLK